MSIAAPGRQRLYNSDHYSPSERYLMVRRKGRPANTIRNGVQASPPPRIWHEA